MEIYLATKNQNKVKEIQEIMDKEGLNVKVHSAEEVGGMPPVEETEDTFEGNARLKAKALLPQIPLGSWVLADDSGLSVFALDGAPGVYSARYAGEGATDEDNYKKLLEELKETPDAERCARFLCALVLIKTDNQEASFTASVKGRITREPQGTHGFGYDPVFMPNGHDATFAELGPEVKNRIGHRGFAMMQLVDWLKQHLPQA